MLLSCGFLRTEVRSASLLVVVRAECRDPEGAQGGQQLLKSWITWCHYGRAIPKVPEVHGEWAPPLGRPFHKE